AEFPVLGKEEFLHQLARYEEERGGLRGICSIERLRESGIVTRLERAQPALDLLIVDEAHYARNARTLTYRLLEALSIHAHAVVFLTATPLQTSDENLFNLLRLLSPDDFDTLDAFRERIAPAEHLNNLRRL